MPNKGRERPITATFSKMDINVIKADLEAERARSRLATEQADAAKAEKQAIEKELEDLRALVRAAQMVDKSMKENTQTPGESQAQVPTNDLPAGQPTPRSSTEKLPTNNLPANQPTPQNPTEITEQNNAESVYLCGSIFDAGGVSSVKRLWPNGQILSYRFIDGHPQQHTKVTQVITEWSRYANILFKLVDRETTPPSSTIVVTFKHASCWGYIGTDVSLASDSPFTMALGAVSESARTTHADRALILHQFGHALGLVHEHMCPSETDAVALKQDLIAKYYGSRYHEASIGKYFDTYVNGSVTNYSAPDLSSVMVYAMPGEFNEGKFPVEPNSTLSPLDKAFMVINYPRSRVHSQASEWTLRHALLIADVDEGTSRTITEEHDLAKRRVLFADYISNTRRKHSPPLVDPAPKFVLDLTLPSVQDALRAFFADGDNHSVVEELRADADLMQELGVVLDRLASYHAVREVVQDALPAPVSVALPLHGNLRVDETFTTQLIELVAGLYTAIHSPTSKSGPESVTAIQIDAATALCNELAYHPTFRHAMERALEKGNTPPKPEALRLPATANTLRSEQDNIGLDDDLTAPDVSAIIEQLSKRPAILHAVRRALVG